MADSIWWTKMLHKDYCAHYCEMSDSEIVADVRRSVASLMMQRSEGSDFGAMMVRMAMERIEAKHSTAVSNGQQGGRPRKSITADGELREGSHDGKSGTSANIYGDAPRSDEGEAINRRESGALAPTTVSMNYDKETDRRIGTDEALDLLRAGVTATSPAPTRSGSAMPSDVCEVYAFAAAEGLDSADAYECWSATVERGGKTADGKKVSNWKAYVRKWCATRANNRRTA